MRISDSTPELLSAIPDAVNIRTRLEHNLRESRLLRRMLRLALDKEKALENDQASVRQEVGGG